MTTFPHPHPHPQPHPQPATSERGRAKHVLLIGGRAHNVEKLVAFGLRYSMVQLAHLTVPQHADRAEHYAILDYLDQAQLMSTVRDWHARDPFDAVVSFTEYGLEPASRCAAALGVPGDNLQAVLATRDKSRTRELLREAGLSPVRHLLCETLGDAQSFLAGLGGTPIVIKPPSGGLSEGVYLVTDRDHLAERWAWTGRFAEGPILVEEYLEGPEYSVESVSRGGKHEIVMITEKVTAELPGFVELGHQAPARLTSADRAAVIELVETFLDLIGQRTGPVHTEVRITAAGVRLIEAQTRVGGDQIWEICELVTGIDMIAETMAGLLDLPVPARLPTAGAAAIRFFGYEDAEVLAVHGLDQARQSPGAVRVVCSLAAGQLLGPLTSSDVRQGYVLSVGQDTDQAVEHAETAHRLVVVDAVPRARAVIG